ncbi:MAG: hypothetical protein V2I45_00320 [Halieaceae bacterium]|jgi:D-glycerate 3-kinase|nr:hypothetical protein [Halieaceae bacterium]
MPDHSAFDSLPWATFLAQQRLPDAYRYQAEQWFLPLINTIDSHRREADRPILIAINGSQGSGKSTLAALLEMALPRICGLSAHSRSLDDFYLTRAERVALAAKVHPLLATRGVPGTHDVALMGRTLTALRQSSGTLAVPAFDKASDDRLPSDAWEQVVTPVDVMIWEGWCLGVPPQPENALTTPINQLEAEEDPGGDWRRYVNDALARDYQPLFAEVDLWVMLAAPNFDCVHRWRNEQEQKLQALRGTGHAGLMSTAEVGRFVQFYQRLTEWGLEVLPERMDFCYALNDERQIESLQLPAHRRAE